jgi:hypothetical protein
VNTAMNIWLPHNARNLLTVWPTINFPGLLGSCSMEQSKIRVPERNEASDANVKPRSVTPLRSMKMRVFWDAAPCSLVEVLPPSSG